MRFFNLKPNLIELLYKHKLRVRNRKKFNTTHKIESTFVTELRSTKG